jgi:hypothetical protein
MESWQNIGRRVNWSSIALVYQRKSRSQWNDQHKELAKPPSKSHLTVNRHSERSTDGRIICFVPSFVLSHHLFCPIICFVPSVLWFEVFDIKYICLVSRNQLITLI